MTRAVHVRTTTGAGATGARREILAIIPARGGSRGIPGKNVALVAGRPLLAYTVEHACRTPEVTRIVVSTDDAGIAAVARREGAEVVWRPAELSGDAAASESALLHVLHELHARDGYEPELVVFLQATSPLRRPDEISQALRTFDARGADSLFSACATHGFLWRREGTQLSSFSYDYRYRQRRQDGPEEFVENGSIYISKPWVLRELQNRLGGAIAVHVMDPLDSFQVDVPNDLVVAARLLAPVPAEPSAVAAPPADLADVRLLVLDFDGVMTDDRVQVDENGREAAWCHRGDGWGIARLREAGISIVVLSAERVAIAAARSRKLGIECVHGCDDKLTRLLEMAAARDIGPAEIAYVGNDRNDLPCLRWVGVPIAVADARPEVRAAARWVTPRAGGHGAVRDVADALLAARTARTARTARDARDVRNDDARPPAASLLTTDSDPDSAPDPVAPALSAPGTARGQPAQR